MDTVPWASKGGSWRQRRYIQGEIRRLITHFQTHSRWHRRDRSDTIFPGANTHHLGQLLHQRRPEATNEGATKGMNGFMIRDGDPTTTGGRVVACTSTMFEDGKRLALHGDKATCGNCKGAFHIVGSGTDCTEDGRAAVLHGDPVLCPCGKNKVLTGANAGCYVESGWLSGAASTAAARAVRISATGSCTYNDRFVLRDCDGHPLAFSAYSIRREEGHYEYGETDAAGRTHLLSSVASAESVEVLLAG